MSGPQNQNIKSFSNLKCHWKSLNRSSIWHTRITINCCRNKCIWQIRKEKRALINSHTIERSCIGGLSDSWYGKLLIEQRDALKWFKFKLIEFVEANETNVVHWREWNSFAQTKIIVKMYGNEHDEWMNKPSENRRKNKPIYATTMRPRSLECFRHTPNAFTRLSIQKLCFRRVSSFCSNIWVT